MASELPRLLDTASKFALFSASGLKDEKLMKKRKSTWKLEHANSILASFEHFCQISSKLILTILSYTVSKLVRFLRHSVQWLVTSDSSLQPCVNVKVDVTLSVETESIIDLMKVLWYLSSLNVDYFI